MPHRRRPASASHRVSAVVLPQTQHGNAASAAADQ